MKQSDNIHFCPLCGSEDIRVMRNQNFRCNACGNSFVAKKS